MEPEPGRMDWGWLDRAIDTLGRAGLKVVLGTPTATPPRWMVDRHPDMLAVDRDGRVRGFGSRRHYDFAHQGYRGECAKIVTALAERYGKNPHVAAWQTDNEYACNETTLSYSEAARAGFRDWLAQKYQSPDALNRAWGNVFWSMEYRDFQEIGLPNLTVCEPNPSHVMDFRRFFQRPGGHLQQAAGGDYPQALVGPGGAQLHGGDHRVRPLGRRRGPGYRVVGQLPAGVSVGPDPGGGRAQAALRAAGRPGFPGVPP
jgi:hypothetical protein